MINSVIGGGLMEYPMNEQRTLPMQTNSDLWCENCNTHVRERNKGRCS